MDKKVPSKFELAYRARDSRARLRNRNEPGQWIERKRIVPVMMKWIDRHDRLFPPDNSWASSTSGRTTLAFMAGVTVRTIQRWTHETVFASPRGDALTLNGGERYLSIDTVDRLFMAMDCEHLLRHYPSTPGGSDGFADVYFHESIVGDLMPSVECLVAV